MTHRNIRDTAFLGGVTAGATHEIRNVLAIVKESAGLVEDCCLRGVPSSEVDLERVRRALDRIGRQVARGTALMVSLSRIAHTGEESASEIDLGRELEHTVLLAQRLGRPRSQQVRLDPGDASVTARVDPFLFQELLFCAVEMCLSERVPGATLALRPLRADGRPAVALTCEDAPDADTGMASQAAVLEELAAELGAEVHPSGDPDGLIVVLPA